MSRYRPKLVVVYSTPEDTTPEPDWVSKTYAYTDSNHVHAVSSVVVTNDQNNQTTNTYLYDPNGNMTCRTENGDTFIQSYNWENRLSGVELVSGNCTTPGETQKEWAFTYDGDGSRVKQVYTVGTTVTTTYYFMGGSYEVQVTGSTETVRQYYSIAGVAVGMRKDETVNYFLSDHLGSVVGVTNSLGAMVSETRYLPFGEVRTDVGTISQTDFGYTFQRNLPEMGLLDYRARFYSPSLGRFIQPDSIVPGAGNPQAFNRYSYVLNNPTNLSDPTGHKPCNVESNESCGQITGSQIAAEEYAIELFEDYNVLLLGSNLSFNQVNIIRIAIKNLSNAMGGAAKVKSNIGGVTISIEAMENSGEYLNGNISLRDSGFSKWTVVHELSHAWDANFSWGLSKALEAYSGGFTSPILSQIKKMIGNCDNKSQLPGCNTAGYFYGTQPPKGSNEGFNRSEDFAESVTAYVYELLAESTVNKSYALSEYKQLLYYPDYSMTLRWTFVDYLLINGNPPR